MTDPDDITPAQSPSARLKLGIEGCPACARTGTLGGETCFYCEGARVVVHDRAEAWRQAHGETSDGGRKT